MPHRGPAQLLSRVLEHHDALTVCEAHLVSPMQYFESGQSSPALCIELGAQAAAAHASLVRGQLTAAPRVGHLVSCPNMQFFGGPLLEGCRLRVSVTPTTSEESWRLFHLKIEEGEALRAEGDIAVHLPPEIFQNPANEATP